VVERGGVEVGVVKHVQTTGKIIVGTPILEVAATDGSELLIPLAQDICVNVDTAKRVIEVVLPEGLLEVNRT
jgi:16S rRNA processing protein RimM